MSFLTPQSQLDYEDSKRRSELSWYIGNPEKKLRGHLFDFCVDILGYDALSESFHKPMLDAWDRLDLKRWRQFMGLEPMDGSAIDRMDLWPRGHIKTWCQRAAVIRYYLTDPTCTVTWWHAVEAKAVESGEAIAEQLLKNKKLRALFPAGVLPAMNRKKFFTGGTFRLNSQKIGDAPSMVCMGAGGESTGAHSVVGVLDDFVGWNDVTDNQMPKKKQFYKSTVRNVVLRTKDKRGWVDCIGTPWDIADPYVEWMESPDWISRVISCSNTDGRIPGVSWEPLYLSVEQIEKELREQGSILFGFQMMCAHEQSTEKPWVPAECEHRCTIEEAKGPGWVVSLGDPAPFAVGSVGGRDERWRKDGTKNWWAIGVVKLRRKGDLLQIILLDADQSKEWDLEAGCKAQVRMAMRWHANEGYMESTSTPVYLQKFIEAKKELGWKGYIIGSRRLSMGDSDDKLKQTYNANAKVNYMVDLCARARQAEFIVCESVPKQHADTLLEQARGFMPLPDGRTGIPFDDMLNMVSFATDPYFRGKYAAVSETYTWSPFATPEPAEKYDQGGRYVRW